MDFRFTEAQDRLRAEVAAFAKKELEQGSYQPITDCWMDGYSPEFSRKVGERGWLGVAWPQEVGGKGWSYMDRLIITEELLRYGCPVAFHWIAERQVGPCLIAYGSAEQKQQYLTGIKGGELSFALGMSEPDAGSDLASLKTTAQETSDGFIINGQKVWTSGAHLANYVYLVARTDPNAPKHRGISEFIVDTHLPGVTIRPILDLMGSHHFNEVFLDNVKVPKNALVGERNRGWYQIAVQLDYERSGIERVMSNYVVFQGLMQFGRENPRWKGDPEVRAKLADLMVRYEVGRLLIYRVAWVLSQHRTPNYESAMAKTYGTAFEQHLANLATQLLGLGGQLLTGSKGAPLNGMAARTYLFCPGYTLRGGTSEILRNVIAIRGLGLPAG